MKSFQLLLLSLLISVALVGQNRITGSTTRDFVYVPLDPDVEINIRDLIGKRELDFGMMSLDGKTNMVKIDVSLVKVEMSSETGGGKIAADLKIIELFVLVDDVGCFFHLLPVELFVDVLSSALLLHLSPEC